MKICAIIFNKIYISLSRKTRDGNIKVTLNVTNIQLEKGFFKKDFIHNYEKCNNTKENR